MPLTKCTTHASETFSETYRSKPPWLGAKNETRKENANDPDGWLAASKMKNQIVDILAIDNYPSSLR